MPCISIWPHHVFAPWWASLALLPRANHFRAMCDGVQISPKRSAGYLQELCMLVNMNTRRSTLRSASDGQLIVPWTKTKTGERAFSVAGPLAWNSLPVTVRQLSSLSSCKRHLKTYLFNASFPSWCYKASLRFVLTLCCYINYQVIIIIIKGNVKKIYLDWNVMISDATLYNVWLHLWMTNIHTNNCPIRICTISFCF